jgi:hypothetical protein
LHFLKTGRNAFLNPLPPNDEHLWEVAQQNAKLRIKGFTKAVQIGELFFVHAITLRGSIPENSKFPKKWRELVHLGVIKNPEEKVEIEYHQVPLVTSLKMVREFHIMKAKACRTDASPHMVTVYQFTYQDPDNYSCALVPVATLLMPKNCPEVPEDITEELIGDPTIRTWA